MSDVISGRLILLRGGESNKKKRESVEEHKKKKKKNEGALRPVNEAPLGERECDQTGHRFIGAGFLPCYTYTFFFFMKRDLQIDNLIYISWRGYLSHEIHTWVIGVIINTISYAQG
jgi:hypothetical protein